VTASYPTTIALILYNSVGVSPHRFLLGNELLNKGEEHKNNDKATRAKQILLLKIIPNPINQSINQSIHHIIPASIPSTVSLVFVVVSSILSSHHQLKSSSSCKELWVSLGRSPKVL